MTYDWEEKITQELLDEIDLLLPDGIYLAGIAVFDDESVEGALVSCSSQPTSLAGADIWNDINGDAQGAYLKAFAEWREEMNEVRRKK